MKLSIRRDIVTKITSNLKNLKPPLTQVIILLGSMTRESFLHSLSEYDFYTLRKKLNANYDRIFCEEINYTISQDIGFINNYYLLICHTKHQKHQKQEKKTSVECYNITESYNIILNQDNYKIYIQFTQPPMDISVLFNPIKFIYESLNSPLQTIDNDSEIICSFNKLFNKDSLIYPYIPIQTIKILNKNNIKNINNDFIVMPIKKGKSFVLFLSIKGAYLISKQKMFRIEAKVPKKLYNTVVIGDWNDNVFVGYDIMIFSDNNIRKKSLLNRMLFLSIVCKFFPFCKLVKYYHKNLAENTQKLLKYNEGVIFAPVKANYHNNKTFSYQPIDKIGIKFKIKMYKKYGFNNYNFYALTDDNNFILFKGSKKFPYNSSFPLSREDRIFIGPTEATGPIDNIVFEFRWESDGFMPYQQFRKDDIDNIEYSKRIWEYINDPIDKNTLIISLDVK